MPYLASHLCQQFMVMNRVQSNEKNPQILCPICNLSHSNTDHLHGHEHIDQARLLGPVYAPDLLDRVMAAAATGRDEVEAVLTNAFNSVGVEFSRNRYESMPHYDMQSVFRPNAVSIHDDFVDTPDQYTPCLNTVLSCTR